MRDPSVKAWLNGILSGKTGAPPEYIGHDVPGILLQWQTSCAGTAHLGHRCRLPTRMLHDEPGYLVENASLVPCSSVVTSLIEVKFGCNQPLTVTGSVWGLQRPIFNGGYWDRSNTAATPTWLLFPPPFAQTGTLAPDQWRAVPPGEVRRRPVFWPFQSLGSVFPTRVWHLARNYVQSLYMSYL